jgi:hypothetical protein
MILESIESRALAAIRFIDAETRAPCAEHVVISGEGLRIVRSLSGLHVVMDAPGFSDYAAHFDLPSTPPAPQTFTLVARTPSRRYLPRSFTLQLPRDTSAQTEPLPPDSVFLPVDVTLYPSQLMSPSARSAVVRIRVEDMNGQALPDALVALSLADPELERWGLSNEKGEALILVPGIPIADWGDLTVPTEFTFSLRAAWAASALPPNPDTLSAAFHPLADTLDIAAGAEVSTTIQLDWVEL